MTFSPNLNAHLDFAHLMTFDSLMQTFLLVCLHRRSNISVVMVEIKQHLSQNSLRLPNIRISRIWIRGGKKNFSNIFNELKLFLKQAQKRLIYLKYLKSLA